MATTKTTKKTAATKKAVTKKTAAKKTAAPAKKATSKKTAAKATAKKAATKKATSARKPVEVKARKATAGTTPGGFGRLADSAKAFASQAVSTAGVLGHEVAHTATTLGTAAKTKAQNSVTRSKDFIRNHPGEAVGLATAGLTVAAAVLGRKRVGSLAKAAAVTGLASKATQVASKAGKLLKNARSKF